MSKEIDIYCADPVIRTIRGQKVILDNELARIYGVEVKRLNEQIKRNGARFPSDFMFRLTRDDFESVQLQQTDEPCVKMNRSQIATGSCGLGPHNATLKRDGDRSQSVTGSQKHRDPRFLPYAFTEHGTIMVATVLNSPFGVKKRRAAYRIRHYRRVS